MPARLAVTHSALQRLVVGGEGEDDHGAQIGDHIDIEGDGPELAPLVPQQFVDGLHSQHLVAVLWGVMGRLLNMGDPDGLTPAPLPPLPPPNPFLSARTQGLAGDWMGIQNQPQSPGLSI